jgi:pimeloyl-ACP methyl ester carboxylesterase
MFAPVPVPACFTAEFPLAMTLPPRKERARAEETVLMDPDAAVLASRYRGLRLPIAIVAGRDDRLVKLSWHAERLHQELPGSILTVVPGRGHMVYYGNPSLITGAIDAVAPRR